MKLSSLLVNDVRVLIAGDHDIYSGNNEYDTLLPIPNTFIVANTAMVHSVVNLFSAHGVRNKFSRSTTTL